MEVVPVARFVKDSRFDGFLLVRTSEQRAASNGSKYLDAIGRAKSTRKCGTQL